MTSQHIEPVDPASDAVLARELLVVQQAAYEAEATLIGDARIPPLHETVEELRGQPLQWLAVRGMSGVLGAIGWAHEGAGIAIDRLMVAESARRRGIGAALVRAVLHRAAERPVTVSTGRDNLPARALYHRLGFTQIGDREVLPGLWITDYRR